MTGTLHKVTDRWFVTYGASYGGAEIWPISFMLHPTDVDNIATITSKLTTKLEKSEIYLSIDFYVVEECDLCQASAEDNDCSCRPNFTKYAKLMLAQ